MWLIFFALLINGLFCFEINDVKRQIDLSANVLRENVEIDLDCHEKCTSFEYFIKPHYADEIALINAQAKSNGKFVDLNPKRELKHSEEHGNIVLYKFEFKDIKPTKMIIKIFYLPSIAKALPAELKQNERQFLLINMDMFIYSPYLIKNQMLIFKLPQNAKIESYTNSKESLVSIGSSTDVNKDLKQMIKFKTISYGPFLNVKSFSSADVTIHYEHNVPIPVITNLNREIIISHWGMIAVKESIDLINAGATLKPPFSRLKFQQPGGEPGIALTSFQTILPPLTTHLTYKDEIGNISTSNVRIHSYDSEHDGPVEILIRPRFPLFGGWKTFFTLSYVLPTYPFLNYDSPRSVFRLKMRLVDHIYHDQIIKQAKIRVILPEGSSVYKVDTPFSMDKVVDLTKPLERYYTYLDTVGRPVVEMTKSNMIDEHIQEFKLEYKFPTMYMLQEPLLLIGAYLLLFSIVIIYVRLDFSITKDEVSETKLRVSGQIEKLRLLVEERNVIYDSYVACINTFKSDKDLTAFTNGKKKVEHDLKKLSQKISDLQSQLKADSSDVAEKINEIQNLDKTLRDQIMSVWVTNAEKAVAGKMARQMYTDAEKISSTKKDDILFKMSSILD